MSRLLEQAIRQLRELPEDDQDLAADVLFAYLSSDEREYQHPIRIIGQCANPSRAH